MTDRRWPPASVWLLSFLLVVPVAGLFVWLVVAQGLSPQALSGGGLGLPVTAALLAGWRGGWWLALLGVVYMLVGSGGFLYLTLTEPKVPLVAYLVTAVPCLWTTVAGGLLWWPATRRWCGVFAPLSYAEDDP